MIIKWWDKYGTYWQIFTPILLGAFIALVTAVWWVKDVSDTGPKLEKAERRLDAMDDKLNQIPVIAQKVDDGNRRIEDIAAFIGVKKRGHYEAYPP